MEKLNDIFACGFITAEEYEQRRRDLTGGAQPQPQPQPPLATEAKAPQPTSEVAALTEEIGSAAAALIAAAEALRALQRRVAGLGGNFDLAPVREAVSALASAPPPPPPPPVPYAASQPLQQPQPQPQAEETEEAPPEWLADRCKACGAHVSLCLCAGTKAKVEAEARNPGEFSCAQVRRPSTAHAD
eukprot:TRINITY_DN27_c0_g1_i2.p1 TRINITY_DN27_c0_g1~~TRINITY_DN27_c0_g1_i2.p1  ORF type:complete len:187 (+),score=74.23 TRINITY_DN27_c0_g1_i2:146-706(+)